MARIFWQEMIRCNCISTMGKQLLPVILCKFNNNLILSYTENSLLIYLTNSRLIPGLPC